MQKSGLFRRYTGRSDRSIEGKENINNRNGEQKREREFSKRASISVKTARDEQYLGHSWFVNSIYQLLFIHRHVRDINVPTLMVLHVTGVELETTNKSVNEVSERAEFPARHPYF